MKKVMRKWMVLAGIALSVASFARENVADDDERRTLRGGDAPRLEMKFGNDCDPATQQADLDVNNVRTRILNGGDMWWDLSNARYEVPKIEDINSVRKNSLFSGAIWIGGEDGGGNLRLAAMTYRQRGSDFWPGPLDETTGNTSSATCDRWDKIFKVDGENIIETANSNGAIVDDQLLEWPGQQPGERAYAPFKDVDGDGFYDARSGDYPVLQSDCKGIEIGNAAEDQPDQMLWWIYNDRGNIHSETQGEPIGVEMQTTAFAFSTNDEINDMTFYTTRITKRGGTNLENTYFGQWVDADLGNFSDDYVGCDVGLSLGFCYNGDDNDEGVLGYGLNPPSVGVDFFEGPTVVNAGITEELGMSKFVYYNNNRNPINGNPTVAPDFYNLMQGKWMNGADIEFGGDGITGTDGSQADFMFPFDTDPAHPDKTWNERQAGNAPADRRFIQSSGPFILEPGAVQRLTVGVVWARTSFGGAEGSLKLLKQASRAAQELFNSCFDLIDGPDAPEIEIHESDKQIVLSFAETESSRVEGYRDSVFNEAGQLERYNFQGYRVFQLKDGSVSLSELRDASKAREVFQCDYIDDFEDLFEEEYDVDIDDVVLKLSVRAENNGIRHTVRLTEDQFAVGSDKRLVNFKDYYYIVVSYAAADAGARNFYLEGRKVQKFSATPHKLDPKLGGSGAPSFYGDGPEMTRLSGFGNGDNVIELTEASRNAILINNSIENPIYENGAGPVNIAVIDALKVPQGDFELSLVPISSIVEFDNRSDSLYADSTTWILVNLTTGDTAFADTNIRYRNEQVITEKATGSSLLEWGMAVTIEQVAEPGRDAQQYDNNGLLSWSVEFSDPTNEWLTAVQDQDVSESRAFGVFDWIRSGVQGQRFNQETPPEQIGFDDPSFHDSYTNADGGRILDRNGVFEKIWEGRVAPFRLVSTDLESNAPERAANLVQAFGKGISALPGLDLGNLNNIDLVITPDQSKWSECVMIELGEDPGLNVDGTPKFEMRTGTSDIVWQGQQLKPGKTIFPGYAIDLNTGERLNIIVGEDSYQRSENGNDMKWNPTDNAGFINSGYPSFGGRHFIYVMGSHVGLTENIHPKLPIYDKGEMYHEMFTTIANGTASTKLRELTKIYQNCDWVIPTYLEGGRSLIENEDGIPVPPNEFTLKLRLTKPYEVTTDNPENQGMPKYSFNTNDIFNDISLDNAKDAIDLINIVPNPYYAFSEYESSPVDNRVKFTNLPPQCDISIYTLDGSLVRRIKKDDETTEADWNLKNNAQVPVASGLYIIHVDAGEAGEKILKWMGVMRELDLDSF